MKKIKKLIFGILLLFTAVVPNQSYCLVEDCTNGIVFGEVFNNLNEYTKLKAALYDIYIVEDKICDIKGLEHYNDNVLGLIQYGNKRIYITEKSKYRDNPQYTLYHELGHSLDCWDELDNTSHRKEGKYSSTNEFYSIFRKEKKDLYLYSDEKYFLTKESEYFAEAFAIYMTNGEKMKTIAPLTYEYIDKVYNQPIIDNSFLIDYKRRCDELKNQYCIKEEENKKENEIAQL